MNRPNSRNGCRALAKLARKLQAVLNVVAAQDFPADLYVQSNLFCKTARLSEEPNSGATMVDCLHVSVKTKTISEPTPMITKRATQFTMLILASPENERKITYARGIDSKIRSKPTTATKDER